MAQKDHLYSPIAAAMPPHHLASHPQVWAAHLQQRVCVVSNFSYICPEPVLANIRCFASNGGRKTFPHLTLGVVHVPLFWHCCRPTVPFKQSPPLKTISLKLT